MLHINKLLIFFIQEHSKRDKNKTSSQNLQPIYRDVLNVFKAKTPQCDRGKIIIFSERYFKQTNLCLVK